MLLRSLDAPTPVEEEEEEEEEVVEVVVGAAEVDGVFPRGLLSGWLNPVTAATGCSTALLLPTGRCATWKMLTDGVDSSVTCSASSAALDPPPPAAAAAAAVEISISATSLGDAVDAEDAVEIPVKK